MTIGYHLPAGLHYAAVDGIRIAVEVVHNGPPSSPTVAWLHGLGSSSIVAFGQTTRHPALRGITSLLIDLPGHGLSTRPEAWSYSIEEHAGVVNQVVARVAGGPVTLVGHSMGGTVAIACAASAQEAVERLIVAEPSLGPECGPLSRHIASQTERRFVDRGQAALLRLTARQAARGDVAAQAFLPSLRLASPVAMHRTAVSLRGERSPSFRELLSDFKGPKAWIGGDRSGSFEQLLDSPDLRRYVVPHAGHVMMAENPDGFSEAIAAALAQANH